MLEPLEARRLYAATPNDTDYAKQTDLAAIDVQRAWAKTTGSLNVVVADIDTGLDYTHPDLYANVWINQDEIPENVRKHLKDVDGDGRISFYDLNSKKNKGLTTDVNANGVIDAGDLLQPTKRGGWDDGVDADGNGYTDDIVGWDFAGNDNNPFDYVGHGSHTAGTIAATRDNDYGIAGIATTSLMVVKIFNDDGTGATEDQIAAAIRYSADEGARVSNNSWGYTLTSYGGYALTADAAASATPTYYYPPPGRPGSGGYGGGYGYGTTTDPIEAAIAYAGTKGQTFVAAAGNDTADNDFSFLGSYPASYDEANIVSVAAVDGNGALSYFSNYGANTVDLAAPGEQVYSTWLKNGFYTASGTSMATPHVTGTIALMLARYPKLTTAQIQGDLAASVNVNTALYSDLVTGGTLDAGQAVYLAAVQRSEALGHDSGATATTLATTATGTSLVRASTASVFTTLASVDPATDPRGVLV